MPTSEHDELGLKVQRANLALQEIRGNATIDGIHVVVDAQHRLLAVSTPEGRIIVEAYNAAILDAEPRVEDAVRELREDPTIDAVSTFVRDNPAHMDDQRLHHESDRGIEEPESNRSIWGDSAW
ncbi:hypothetical protein ACFYO1_34390 [Nocardia sp. NPDC006044]|uniref:hypothetical protein n=1 Tax=Nocardia sp. NPDC006044 TaxID=3364306 RepID=UPI003675313A